MQTEFLLNIIETIVERDGGYVTSSEISDLFMIDETTTGWPVTRACIKEAMRRISVPKGIPIGANSRGYFLIKDKDALVKYTGNLQGRINGIRERIELVNRAWNNSKYVKFTL